METTNTNNELYSIPQSNSSRFNTFYYIIFFISFIILLIVLFFVIAYYYPNSIFKKILIKLTGGPTQSEKVAAVKAKISSKKNSSNNSSSNKQSGNSSSNKQTSNISNNTTSGNTASGTTNSQSLDEAVEQYKYQQNYINMHMMQPPSTTEAITHKDGWCLIGNEKGYNSCVKVGYNDYCMSGDIYPTKDICLNPSLRL